jgi:hypothetical protein
MDIYDSYSCLESYRVVNRCLLFLRHTEGEILGIRAFTLTVVAKYTTESMMRLSESV